MFGTSGLLHRSEALDFTVQIDSFIPTATIIAKINKPKSCKLCHDVLGKNWQNYLPRDDKQGVTVESGAHSAILSKLPR